MARKDYQKPIVRVIKLQHQTQLLAGSGGLGAPGQYTPGGNPLG